MVNAWGEPLDVVVPETDGEHRWVRVLCHQSLSSRQSPSKPKLAIAMPSSASRGSASPFWRAIRFVPVDAAQMRNSSSEVTW